jgi:uncharacterized membrane protein
MRWCRCSVTGKARTYLAVIVIVVILLVRLVTALKSFAALGCNSADFFLGAVGEVVGIVVVSRHDGCRWIEL